MPKKRNILFAEEFHDFRHWLAINGYAVLTEVIDFRVLMFRKHSLPWTQVYANTKNENFVLAGPEAKQALKLFRGTRDV